MEIIIIALILGTLVWVFRKTLKVLAKASAFATEAFAEEAIAEAIKRKSKIRLSDEEVAKALEVEAKLEKFGIDL